MSETVKEPRSDKVAVVAEVAEKLQSASAVFVTEYRGLSVGQLAAVRSALRPVGAELTVYKNTLALRAAQQVNLGSLEELLVGPTCLTFARGDIAAAAKALKDFAKANPALVIKGGLLGTVPLTAQDVMALADLPSRQELLAMFAGALQAPLVKTAGLLQALPRNFAYGLSALIDQKSAQ